LGSLPFFLDQAKIIAVDEMTIVNWEEGRKKPAKGSLERIKIMFKV
jgi:DNA-binding transcriptional regulator YiaG